MMVYRQQCIFYESKKLLHAYVESNDQHLLQICLHSAEKIILIDHFQMMEEGYVKN